MLQTIQNYGIPTNSYIKAVQFVNDQGLLSQEEYQRRVGELLGQDVTFTDEDQARLFYLYVVQETVRAGDEADIDTVKQEAERRVGDFNENMSWVFVTAEDNKSEEDKSSNKTDAQGNPKPRKGRKKELAKQVWNENKDKGLTRKQFIELLVEQVGLTKAGASTYYSNLKAGRY